MSVNVIGYPEITELTTLELSSLVITPTSVVDVTVNQQDEVQVIVTEVINDITVAEGIVVSIPSLDDVPDGVTYAKVIAEVLQEGKVILSEAIGTLDDIQNGTNYAKILASATVDGLITLEEVVGTLDDIAEGVTYGKIKLSALSPGTGFVLTDYLIDGTYAKLKAAALDVNGFVVMDNVIDGTYARVKASGLTAEGLVALDQVVDGTYSKVLTTSVLGGLIKVTELVNDAGDAADLDDLPDGTTYGRVASTSISAGKIKLDEGILDGTTYARVRSTVLEAGKILLAETIAVGGSAASIDDFTAEGVTYKRVKAAALDTNGLVLVDQTVSGTYGKVLASNITSTGIHAGKILLTASNNTDFNANYVAEVSGKYWSPLSDSPAGTGLFITTDYIGYYTASAWTCYIKNDGTFKFYGNATNYLEWNGATLTIKGALTLASITDVGDLAAQDTADWQTDVTGTGKPSDNADVTLTAVNGGLSVTGGGITLTSGSPAIKAGQTAYNTGSGFWLGLVSGTPKFSIGNSAGNYFTWDGSSITIIGGGTFSGALSAATGTFAGSLSAATGTFAGSLSAATGTFAGSISAATGTFTGSISSTSVIATGGSFGMWTIGATYFQSASSGQRIVFTAGATPTIKAYDAFGNYMQVAANYISWYEGVTKYMEFTGRGIYFYNLSSNTLYSDGYFYLNATALELKHGTYLRFGSATAYLYRANTGVELRYVNNDSHRFYISSTEKFWVHSLGVGVTNTHFSVTSGNRIYLDGYTGAVYASCPAANIYRITATYFEITSNNLTSNNGSIAVGASTYSGYLLFRSNGTSYKIKGTAI